MPHPDPAGQLAHRVAVPGEPCGRQLLVREAPRQQRHGHAARRGEVHGDRCEAGVLPEPLHGNGQMPGVDRGVGELVGGHAGAKRRVDRRLEVGAAGVRLERERVREPRAPELAEHRRPCGEREVAQQAAPVLDHAERPVDALGGEQRGARALHGRLGGRQELRGRPHEAGPQPVRRLVERDRQRVPEPLAVEPQPESRRDGAGGAVDRRPELAVVRPDQQCRAEPPRHLVRRDLRHQRALVVVGRERPRGPHRRVAGVAHVEVVVPVVRHRGRGAGEDLPERALGGHRCERTRRLLARGGGREHRQPLDARPLGDALRELVRAKRGGPPAGELAEGHRSCRASSSGIVVRHSRRVPPPPWIRTRGSREPPR